MGKRLGRFGLLAGSAGITSGIVDISNKDYVSGISKVGLGATTMFLGVKSYIAPESTMTHMDVMYYREFNPKKLSDDHYIEVNGLGTPVVLGVHASPGEDTQESVFFKVGDAKRIYTFERLLDSEPNVDSFETH